MLQTENEDELDTLDLFGTNAVSKCDYILCASVIFTFVIEKKL